jgi:histidine triad (HIT) family protein
MANLNQNPDCLFCKIVAGEIPCHKVWESEFHLAFLTIFPNTKGVTVVIPKAHVGSYIFEQSDQVITELMLASKKVAQMLDAHFEDVGRCGVVFEGFGVDHLHSKLYPLHGTGNMAEWKMIESGPIDTYFEQYPGYISSNDSRRADDAELAELAAAIRASGDRL